MCGRFGFNLTKRDIEDGFGVWLDGPPGDPGPGADYNIAPDPTSQRPVLVVLLENGERVLRAMNWALLPSWSTDPRRYFINARAETVFDKPAFRHCIRHRRCLVPAGLYYEWKKARGGEPKTPHVFTLGQNTPFALAAIWDHHEDAGTGLAVLTTRANALAATVHDRMPVLFTPESFGAWLDPASSADDIMALLRPYPADKMCVWPVSRAVNNPTRHGPDLIAPVRVQPGLLD